MKKVLSTISIFLLILEVFAYKNVSNSSTNNTRIRTRSADCAQGKTQIDLDINNVRARLLNTGDMWWDREGSAKYGVPKLTADQLANGQRQVNPIFAGSLWLSGISNGRLRMAAIRFSQGEAEFWPGPIPNGSIGKSTCDLFDQFWSVNETEIAEFRKTGKASDNITYWPGTKNPNMASRGINPDLLENGAPFYDANGDGIYNPSDGDYPTVKYSNPNDPNTPAPAVASQMIFWFMNDVGNVHTASGADPMGVQLNCLAFAYISSDEVNNMTFYTYEIFNKSGLSYDNAYISQFVDTDMGNYNDDYVGCDTSRDMGFCVNADAFDEDASALGYKDKVPLVGVDFFEGPKDASGNTLKMSAFNYFVNSTGAVNSDPGNLTEYRNFQEGKNRVGGNFTQGGNCIGGTNPTKFCFPGNPSVASEWSMCSANYPKGDVRFVQHSGPFNMEAGGKQTVSIGIIFVQPPVGAYNGCNVDAKRWLGAPDDLAQFLFDNSFILPKGPDAPEIRIRESKNSLYLSLYNSELSNNFGESFNQYSPPIPLINGLNDSTYKFEGYAVFQVKDPSQITNINDLFDNSKSSVIRLMDIRNDVKDEVFNAVETNGIYDITLKMKLENKGIDLNIEVLEDAFASGNSRALINGKTYYFCAVAFAYNNFKVPSTGAFQLQQLKFSNSITKVSATPHETTVYGLKPNAIFNQGVDVTRVSGTGNNSYFMKLAPGEEKKILEESADLPKLKYLGGYSPVVVRVSDPFKLKNYKYTLSLYDSTVNNRNDTFFNYPKSFYQVEVFDADNGNLIETIAGERNIDRAFQQELYVKKDGKNESTGLTVHISDLKPVSNVRGKPIYGHLGASIEYQDPKKPWLNLLKDVDNVSYRDWIRSGTNAGGTQVNTNSSYLKFVSASNIVNGSRVYSDSNEHYANILDGRIAPYCLSANNSITVAGTINQQTYSRNLYSSFGPGFRHNRLNTTIGTFVSLDANSYSAPYNNLDSLLNVDLVITNDKTKWSRCLVFETFESPEFTLKNALKGQLSQLTSRDIDGNEVPGEVGRSYFPGYAIDLETGRRLNVYFGESSVKTENPSVGNMIWDPIVDSFTALGDPVMGGLQFVYITKTTYDEGQAHYDILSRNFNKDNQNRDINIADLSNNSNTTLLNREVASVYRDLIWTFIPMLSPTYSMYDKSGNYSIPTDVRISIRVPKRYEYFGDDGKNVYEFSTAGMQPERNDSITYGLLEKIAIVPNPYNAYSAYEASSSQNLVKIHNIPNNCTVSIYTLDGVMIRRIKRDIGSNNQGTDITNMYGVENLNQNNIDNTLTWDMKTTTGVLIASGIYYIHIDAPGLGNKVLKFHAVMRSTDVSNF